MNSTTSQERPPQVARLAALIGFAVIFLAGANGIFTFSGAQMYVEETVYAVLFAVAVQLAITTTLLALPYIQGLGRLVLLAVYTAALVLSTLSAFTYVFNASLPEAQQGNLYAMDVITKTRISERLGEALQAEQRFVEARRLELAQMERAAQEEANRGGRSGKGPGRGPEFLRKQEAFENRTLELAGVFREFDEARPLYEALNQRLAGPVSLDERQGLAAQVAGIRVLTHAEEAASILSLVTEQEIGRLRNPVERALMPLLEGSTLSLTTIVSLVWAGIFDLLALFLGIIRYYLLKPDFSILNALHEGILGLATFSLRLGHARADARERFQREHAERLRDQPLNSVEMKSFATWLIAGSELSSRQGADPVEPLRTLVSYIEPLHLEAASNGVGILHRRFEQEGRLKPLMAILVQHQVFLDRAEEACYLLNSSAEMAQKTLVFLRLGMKGGGELPFQGMGLGLPATA